MNSIKPLKKYQITILILFQILLMFSILTTIIKPKVNFKEPTSLFQIILMLLLTLIYIYISKKFLRLKQIRIYKVFFILNVIVLVKSWITTILLYRNIILANLNNLLSFKFINLILFIFYFFNILLILFYNRNIK